MQGQNHFVEPNWQCFDMPFPNNNNNNSNNF
jgi:hypothetical protein